MFGTKFMLSVAAAFKTIANFGKSFQRGGPGKRQNTRAGRKVARNHHFNWRVWCCDRNGRPAWTYRGARRNAMKNTKAVA